MKYIDSCVWDKTHGLVILLPDPQPRKTSIYVVVHTLAQETPPENDYYGGELQPDQEIQVIHVGDLTQFELLLYQDAEQLDNADSALERLAFDSQVTYADMTHDLQTHFRALSVHSGANQHEVVVSNKPDQSYDENPGDFFNRLKTTNQQIDPHQTSWVATPFDQHLQGPSVNPDQQNDDCIPVRFCYSRSQNSAPHDGILLPQFDTLVWPMVVIDLHSFGAAAPDIAYGFIFFHQAYGAAEGEVSWVTASSNNTQYDRQQQTLSYGWPNVCHRDRIGLGFAGDIGLKCHTTDEHAPPFFANCHFAVVKYWGHRFEADSGTTIQYEAQALRKAHRVHLPELMQQTSRAWAAKDDIVAHAQASLEGANHGLAYTVYAFLRFLRRLYRPHTTRQSVTAALERLGYRYNAYPVFLLRADLMWALITDSGLSSQMAAIAHISKRVCLASDLALASEPGEAGLSEWVTQLSPKMQYNAISCLANGILLSCLRQAGVQPDIPYSTLRQSLIDEPSIAQSLSALTPDTIQLAIAVLEDEGYKVTQLSSFSTLSALASVQKQVHSAHETLRQEVNQLNDQLQASFFQCTEGIEAVKARFLSCFHAHNVASINTLKTDILAMVTEEEKLPLAQIVNPLKTRAALLSLKHVWANDGTFHTEVLQFYAWCNNLLRQTHIAWVQPEKNIRTGLTSTDCTEIQTALTRTLESAQNIPQPAWSNRELDTHQRLLQHIEQACEHADTWLLHRIPEQVTALQTTRSTLSMMITQIKTSASWLASCQVWMGAVATWQCIQPEQQSVQPETCILINAQLSSPARKWPDIVEEIDFLALACTTKTQGHQPNA